MKELFEQKPPQNQILDFFTIYQEFKWSFYSTIKNLIIFIYHKKTIKKSDINYFIDRLNEICIKSKEVSKDNKNLIITLKENLSNFFKVQNETDTTFKKIDRANQLIYKANEKMAITL